MVSALRELVALVVGGGGAFSPEACTLRQRTGRSGVSRERHQHGSETPEASQRLLAFSESYTPSRTKASKEVGAGRWPFREDWRFFLLGY